MRSLDSFNEREILTILESSRGSVPPTDKIAKGNAFRILISVLRYNLMCHAEVESIYDGKYTVQYTKTPMELYDFCLNMLYVYIVVELGDVYFFTYLYEKTFFKEEIFYGKCCF